MSFKFLATCAVAALAIGVNKVIQAKCARGLYP